MSRHLLVFIGVLGLFALCLLSTLSLGETVSTGDVIRSFGARLSSSIQQPEQAVDDIVWLLRVPRGIMAIVVGGGLAVVGVAMQSLVRNPLAEPYILGLSSGASAGASLFFLGLLPSVVSRAATLPVAAFLGGLLSVSVVYLIAREGSRLSVARLLLAGVAVSALMGSVTSVVTFASPDPDKLRTVLFWLLGSLGGSRWEVLAVPVTASLVGSFGLLTISRQMDALLTGEEPARSLGVRVESLKTVLIVVSALVTGALVSATGVIGFVGLIVPHVVRLLVGVAHRRVILFSFILGGAFLLWSDAIARLTFPSQELPVGVVTAIFGVPFFLFLLRRSEYRFG